jgi:hypothetical protein
MVAMVFPPEKQFSVLSGQWSVISFAVISFAWTEALTISVEDLSPLRKGYATD